jgi:uncharacterized protein YlxP (DUF503 family)
MHIFSAKLTYFIPHSMSLKEKRQVRKSLIDKTKQKFNVSIAEVATQDIHQTLTLGLSVVSGEFSHGRESMEKILRFVESQGEVLGAELVVVEEL